MHKSLNLWNGIGNVGKKIELRKIGTVPVLEFSLCVDNVLTYPGPNGIVKKVHSRDWIPVCIRGNEAELNYRALQCGSRICITGSLRVSEGSIYVETQHVQWLDNIKNPNTSSIQVLDA